MMPLQIANAQALKLTNTPQLPASLFQNNAPITVSVLSANQLNATILIANQRVNIQSNTPLTPGQQLNVKATLIDGQVQLIPTDEQANENIPNKPAFNTQNLANRTYQQIAQQQPNTTNTMPEWTKKLPEKTQEALANLRQILPNQQSLSSTFKNAGTVLQQILTNTGSPTPASPTPIISGENIKQWQTFIQYALSATPTSEKLQQSLKTFNNALKQPETNNWRQALTQILSASNNHQEKELAQQIIARSDHNEFTQSLYNSSGQGVLLQDIPMLWQNQLHGIHVEVEHPPQQQDPDNPQQWKVFLQLDLDDTIFSCRLQIDKDQHINLQLWGNNAALTQEIQAKANSLKQALTEQGLVIDSLVIATGIPPSKIEQKVCNQPLIDIHS